MEIEIKCNPRTKKNSQNIMINKRTGRPFIMPSKLYQEYLKECGSYVPKLEKSIDYGVNLECHYYMPSRRRVDLNNLLEATTDMLVHYKVIEDDDSRIVVGFDGSRVHYDKENPRTEIKIEKIVDNE